MFDMAKNDAFEYVDEEEDFSWYNIENVMKAIRGYDTEEHPDQFDAEAWTDYWDEGTWQHCNDNCNRDDPES